MAALSEKGGGSFAGIKLILCENPLAAAQAEAPRGNYSTEACSAPLERLIAEQLAVPEGLIHINAGSELIYRFGQQVKPLSFAGHGGRNNPAAQQTP